MSTVAAMNYAGYSPEEVLNAASGLSNSQKGLNMGPIKEILEANGLDSDGSSAEIRARLKEAVESTPAKAEAVSPVFTPGGFEAPGDSELAPKSLESEFDENSDEEYEWVTDSDEEDAATGPDLTGFDVVGREGARIDTDIWTKRCAGLVVVRFDNKPEVGTGMLVHMFGRTCVMTNHHVIRNAEDARHAFIEFDFELDGKKKKQATKWLLSEPDDESFKAKRRGAGSSQKNKGMFFVRMYRPYDITIVQFNAGTSVNYVRKKAAECVFKPVALEPGDTVRILQHPLGLPTVQSEGKVLAVSDMSGKHPKTAAGLPCPGNLQYDARTLPGASGSPIFDSSYNFLGLHHCNVEGKTNGGTTMAAIFAELDRLAASPPETGPHAGRTTVRTTWTGYPGAQGTNQTCDTPASFLWDGSVDNLPEDEGYDDVSIQNGLASKAAAMKLRKKAEAGTTLTKGGKKKGKKKGKKIKGM